MARKKEHFLMVCPRCGSINVVSDLSRDMMAWGASTRWLCKNCDYSSILFPKVEKSELGKFRKNIKLRTKEQLKIINRQSISKGFLTKKVNIWFALFYIITITSVILLVFSEAFESKNYLLMVISLVVLFAFIVVLREYLK